VNRVGELNELRINPLIASHIHQDEQLTPTNFGFVKQQGGQGRLLGVLGTVYSVCPCATHRVSPMGFANLLNLGTSARPRHEIAFYLIYGNDTHLATGGEPLLRS